MSRPFTEMLADLEGGRTAEDLTSAMTELTSAVMAFRKGGTLTLTIGVQPNGETSLEIGSKIKTNIPEPGREKTIMFADEFGGLRREDPRQPRLPLREVERPVVKEISATNETKQV